MCLRQCDNQGNFVLYVHTPRRCLAVHRLVSVGAAAAFFLQLLIDLLLILLDEDLELILALLPRSLLRFVLIVDRL